MTLLINIQHSLKDILRNAIDNFFKKTTRKTNRGTKFQYVNIYVVHEYISLKMVLGKCKHWSRMKLACRSNYCICYMNIYHKFEKLFSYNIVDSGKIFLYVLSFEIS